MAEEVPNYDEYLEDGLGFDSEELKVVEQLTAGVTQLPEVVDLDLEIEEASDLVGHPDANVYLIENDVRRAIFKQRRNSN